MTYSNKEFSVIVNHIANIVYSYYSNTTLRLIKGMSVPGNLDSTSSSKVIFYFQHENKFLFIHETTSGKGFGISTLPKQQYKEFSDVNADEIISFIETAGLGIDDIKKELVKYANSINWNQFPEYQMDVDPPIGIKIEYVVKGDILSKIGYTGYVDIGPFNTSPMGGIIYNHKSNNIIQVSTISKWRQLDYDEGDLF